MFNLEVMFPKLLVFTRDPKSKFSKSMSPLYSAFSSSFKLLIVAFIFAEPKELIKVLDVVKKIL